MDNPHRVALWSARAQAYRAIAGASEGTTTGADSLNLARVIEAMVEQPGKQPLQSADACDACARMCRTLAERQRSPERRAAVLAVANRWKLAAANRRIDDATRYDSTLRIVTEVLGRAVQYAAAKLERK